MSLAVKSICDMDPAAVYLHGDIEKEIIAKPPQKVVNFEEKNKE